MQKISEQHIGEVHPRTGHEGPEGEWRYSSTPSLTSVLHGDGWSTPRTDRFYPRETDPLTIVRRLGGPQCRSGRVRKISDSIPGPSSRSESLYRLSYRDSPFTCTFAIFFLTTATRVLLPVLNAGGNTEAACKPLQHCHTVSLLYGKAS